MIYDIWGSLKIRGPPNSTVDDNCPSSNGPLVTYIPHFQRRLCLTTEVDGRTSTNVQLIIGRPQEMSPD